MADGGPGSLPRYIAMGIGIGLMISPATTGALGAASATERSQASGILQTVRQVGGVICIAVLGTIVAHGSTVTTGVSAAYWTGAAMTALMALVALVTIRRRRG